MTNAVDARPGPGEAAARAKARARTRRMVLLALGGAAIGFVTALVEGKGARVLQGSTIPPLMAVVGALTLLVLPVIAAWRYSKDLDEVQRQDYQAVGAIAANTFLIGYPIWLILWKGGLVPEPIHWVMFLAVFATTIVAGIWRKFL